ncbi:MAG: MFS transporter [Thermodesulfobacteriota bacterium]
MFAIGTLNFVMSMFFRASTAVISPAMQRDLGLTVGQMSDLAAAFFYAFAVSQLPLGVALDRLGPRVTMSLLAVASLTGVFTFAFGQNNDQLLVGRVLLGIGMSGNLMVPLALLAAWFPVDRFAFLSGVIVSIGTLGSILAATPLAALSLWIGWRGSIAAFGVADALILGAFLMVIRDRPPGQSRFRAQPKPVVGDLLRLVGMYSYWAISLSCFVRYGYLSALQSLWMVPFLISGLGMGEIEAGNAIVALSLGYMFGLPVSGSLSDRVLRSRKKVILAGMVVCCAAILAAGWLGAGTPTWMVFFLFFMIGTTAAPGQIMYAHMKELLEPSMVAQAMTAVNFFTVLGAGVMTHVLGFVIGAEPSALTGPAGYWGLWYVGAGALAAVTLMYALVQDSDALKVRG